MKPIIQFNMNNKDRLMVLLSIIFLAFVIVIFIQATRVSQDYEQEPIDAVVIKDNSRQSISFILGEDKEQQNPFYENAATYFRNNPEAKTDEVVTNCRSLVALNRTLEKYYFINEKSFSLINIVVHSNPWSGISVPITDEGKRTQATELEEALKNQIIVALEIISWMKRHGS